MSPVGLVHYSRPVDRPAEPLGPCPDWVFHPPFVTAISHRTHPAAASPAHRRPRLSPPAAEVTYFTVHSDSGELLGAAGFVWDLDYVKENARFWTASWSPRLDANPDVFQGFFFRSPVAMTLLDEHGNPFYTTVPERATASSPAALLQPGASLLPGGGPDSATTGSTPGCGGWWSPTSPSSWPCSW